MRQISIFKFAAVLAAAAAFMPAQASVVIASTRVIFPGGEREVTIGLSNEGEEPALVQAWIDKGDADASPATLDVPFTLTPVMFRMEPRKGQTLRLLYGKQPLAQDKESLFWLNVLEVPPKPKDGEDANRLQLAYRTRIKLMFRPPSLAGKAEEAPANVKWKLVRNPAGKGYALQGFNASPYYVNLGDVAGKSANGKRHDAGAGYIAPGASQTFPLEGGDAGGVVAVVYSAINDWGGPLAGELAVEPLGGGKSP